MTTYMSISAGGLMLPLAVAGGNTAPTITSTAVTTATENVLYSYTVAVTDPGDDLTFTLPTKPYGMTVGSTSGVIEWTPSTSGSANVVVRVTDTGGLFDEQSFTIAVEAADLPADAVLIDSAWLAANGPTPYLLSTAGAYYALTTDVTVNDTAFAITAQNVTFDLNGHTITYDNRTPIAVTNGGFEDGAVGAAPPGWNLAGAPTAAVVANTYAAFGDKVLLISALSGDATIESAPVAITETRQYCAAAWIKGTGNYDAHIYIVDADTGTVIATGYHSTSTVGRGFSVPTVGSITAGTNVKIRIVVHGASSTWFVVDGVQLNYWRDYGVYLKPNWTSNPAHLLVSRVTSSGTYADNCTVKNGTIIQGQAGSSLSDCVFGGSRVNPVIQNINCEISGLDTAGVRVDWAQNATVTSCNIDASAQKYISNRMQLYSAVYALRSGGTFTATNNTITGNPLIGIACTGDAGKNSQVVITDNEVHSDTRYTEGYGIACAGPLVDGVIDNNTITTVTSGRGILLDSEDSYGDSLGITISNNTIDIREYPNLEYGPTGAGLEGTGIRIRGRTGESFTGLRVFGNDVTASCGIGNTRGGIAIRISLSDECTDVEIHDNIFKAINETTDTNYFAQAVSWSGVRSLALPDFYNNVAISNHVCMAWADVDSWSIPTVNTTCLNTTLEKSSEGAVRTFYPLSLGYGPVDCNGHTVYGPTFAGGATHQVQFAGSGTIGLTFGYTFQLTVTDTNTHVPLQGVAVTLTDFGNSVYDLGVTNSSGHIEQVNVATHVYSGTGTSPVTAVKTPHTLTLTKSGYNTHSESVTFNSNKTIAVTLTPA